MVNIQKKILDTKEQLPCADVSQDKDFDDEKYHVQSAELHGRINHMQKKN